MVHFEPDQPCVAPEDTKKIQESGLQVFSLFQPKKLDSKTNK